jgi:uroporphyrinogen-III synthase
MSRPIRILSTRALDAALIGQAQASGISIDIASFIETTPVQDAMLAQQVQALAGESLVVIFTSMNAVEAVVNMFAGARAVSWKIFCIGAATRKLVEKHFGDESVTGTAPSAAALARVVIDAGKRDVVFFCGDQRREELPGILQKGGVRVREIVVYHTIETPHVVKEIYDGVVFFSPSAVRSFFSANNADGTVCFFAIGETTAAAIQGFVPGSPLVISKAPEKEALVRQIIEYFQTSI